MKYTIAVSLFPIINSFIQESTIAPVIPSEFTSKELSGEIAVPKDTHRARLSDADLCQFGLTIKNSKAEPILMWTILDHAAIDLIVAINNELLEKSIINIRRIISDLFARHMDFAADGRLLQHILAYRNCESNIDNNKIILVARVGIIHYGQNVIVPVSFVY